MTFPLLLIERSVPSVFITKPLDAAFYQFQSTFVFSIRLHCCSSLHDEIPICRLQSLVAVPKLACHGRRWPLLFVGFSWFESDESLCDPAGRFIEEGGAPPLLHSPSGGRRLFVLSNGVSICSPIKKTTTTSV
ncbi:unnamed protein product [Linum tenue]|uniref:Uncharacterized protein n=1 Tax=Linum tenue TaxID=586396 RepID=A0AAV0NZM0_9ROSI|nr:unnamed protein product [Linum tenue]